MRKGLQKLVRIRLQKLVRKGLQELVTSSEKGVTDINLTRERQGLSEKVVTGCTVLIKDLVRRGLHTPVRKELQTLVRKGLKTPLQK